MNIRSILKSCASLVLAICFIYSFSPLAGKGGLQVPGEWQSWIKANYQPVLTLNADIRFAEDLRFLQSLLQGKSLVQLGESGHGVSEFNKAKVRLIKFLHEELGYDVIAFESSIFECFLADSLADTLPAEDLMGYSIFSLWHCEETLELFRYIKETKKTDRPLTLAGFDVQISSGTGAKKRPAYFREVIANIDPSFADEVYGQDQVFISNYLYYSISWLAQYGDAFKEFYGYLYRWFDEHMSDLKAIYAQTPSLPIILRQAAWSMIVFIDHMTSNYPASYSYRDKGMADNIGVLADEIFPDKKIMIWAHNMHIQYNNGDPQSAEDFVNMGCWLAQRYAEHLYTIGFFMGSGEAAWNDRSVYEITPAVANSLEAIFYYTGWKYSFVDMLNCESTPGTSWMFKEIPAKSWGYYDTSLIPRQQFDAIFFVRKVHPPHYLTYYGSQSLTLVPNSDLINKE